MRVKRLEIFGFKSFAEKTTIHFESGVTAIVGPNGSGKSNIVDGIRWVLGEHNPRDVRASRLEDVIFNGTDCKAPLSMAEVNLTIDNQRGLLPIAFTEVTITRRVYRSGESECSINQSPCRLKDIQELFLDTGLGGGSYAIIEQGHIDRVLSSKPQERRVVFEEASGVAKYLAKRQETIRRLEEVEEHLVRIGDIVTELRRQVAALERQANKAHQYRLRWEELKSLELQVAADELRQAAVRQEQRAQHLEALRVQQQDFENEKQQHVASLETCHAAVSSKQESLQAKRTALIEVSSQMEQHQNHLTLKTRWIEELTRQVGHLEGEDAQLHSRLSQIDEQLRRLSHEDSEAEQQWQGLQEQLAQTDQQIKEWDKHLQDTVAAMETAKVQVFEAATEASHQRNQLAEHHLRLQGLEAQLGRLENQSGQQVAHQAQLHAHLEELTCERDVLQAQQDEVRRRISSLQQLLDGAQSRRQERMGQLRQVRERLASESAQVSLLEDLQKRYEGFPESVKALMTHSIEGLVGPLVDLIQSVSGYEEMVETALGPLADALVVRDRAALLRCRTLLSQQQLAGARFLVLSDCPDDQPLVSHPQLGESTNALAGSVSQFVQTDPAYQPLVDWLLNDSWVIDDLHRLIQDTALPEVRIVSSKGERWDRRSWRLVGSSASSRVGEGQASSQSFAGAGRLLQRQRLAQTQKTLQSLQQECSQLETYAQQAESDWQSLLSQQESAKGELAHLAPNLHRLDIRIKDLIKETQQQQQHQQTCADELKTAAAQLEQARACVENAQQAASLAQQRQQNAEQALAQAQISREKSLDRHQQLILARTQLAARFQSVTERKEALKVRRQELDSEQQRSSEQRQAKVQQRQEALTRCGELTEQLKGHRELLEQLQTRRLEISAEAEEALLALREEEAKRDAVLPQLLDIEQKLSALMQQTQAEQQQASEYSLRRQSLIQRFQELYQVEEATLEDERQKQQTPLTQEQRNEFGERIRSLRGKLEGFGPVSFGSVEEYDQLTQRLRFLQTQQEDLLQARDDLKTSIAQINRTARAQFRETFAKITQEFRHYYSRLFNGGEANLILTDDEDVLESGIEIVARPPGKRLQNISLLSGGERALTAIALLFALFKVRPSPFCILDEIDAPLDEANVDRFTHVLEEFLALSQFILITHNKKTITKADSLYGVTMQEPGISKILSAKLTQAVQPASNSSPDI